MKFALITVTTALAGSLCWLQPLRAQSQDVERPSLERLWSTHVTPQLANDPWSDALAYDAGHRLMVPLHASFVTRRPQWQREFSSMFERALRDGLSRPVTAGATRRARLHFLHLASRFVVLAGREQVQLIPSGFVAELYRQVHELWDGSGRSGDALRSYVARALREREGRATIAINDNARMLFAVAGDLKQWENLSGPASSQSRTVDDILTFAKRVFTERVVKKSDGGWLFQPGVLSQHPDYLYAGQPEITAGMAPAPLADVAQDASHAHRTPLWLVSLAGAYPAGSENRRFYQELAEGLAIQFFRHVLVPPTADFPTYRTTNYMDGRNGVYRLNYQNRGMTWGYGPYELSGTLDLGWWSFLPTPCAVRLYRAMAESFPRSKKVPRTFSGARSTGRSSWHNDGYRELRVRLAAEVARSNQATWPVQSPLAVDDSGATRNCQWVQEQ